MQDKVIEGLSEFIDAHCLETRKKWKEFSKDEIFMPRFNLSLREQKELALQRLKVISKNRVYSVHDFSKNPLNVFTNHEMAGYIDGSMATKFTVQMNLFGGTLYTLGTERHLSVAEGIDNMSTIGCFCLTELGYGNNAVQMGTTAHYNKENQTFTINTPNTLSQKYWITNGAYHCNYAIVFAQLYMPGDVHEGVHAFLVRVRNDDGSVCKGVFIEDMGAKFALNGVDNGRLSFNQVVISREGLLNRFSDVSPEGVFTSQIKNKRQRFLAVADRLLSGRLCIASMMMTCTKGGLITTLRYGSKRLAMGNTGLSDTPISEFGLFQNQIYPLLARTLMLNLGFNKVKELYAESLLKKEAASQFLICLCCAAKPIISWNTRDVGTTVTERVGGQGYLAANRVCDIMGFAHSGITAEGDNGVLMQKTAKELFALMQKGQYKTAKPVTNQNNFDFSNVQSYIDLLRIREQKIAEELGNQTMQKMGEGKSIYNIWMTEDNDLVQSLARTFGERQISEYALEKISQAPSHLAPYLTTYLKLHLNFIVIKELGWFIFNGVVTNEQAKAINNFHKLFIRNVHPIALATVNSLGFPEHLLTAPIAQDYEKFNEGPNEGEVYRPKL